MLCSNQKQFLPFALNQNTGGRQPCIVIRKQNSLDIASETNRKVTPLADKRFRKECMICRTSPPEQIDGPSRIQTKTSGRFRIDIRFERFNAHSL